MGGGGGGGCAIIEIPWSSVHPRWVGEGEGRRRKREKNSFRNRRTRTSERASERVPRGRNKKPPRLFAIDFGQVRIGSRTHGARDAFRATIVNTDDYPIGESESFREEVNG